MECELATPLFLTRVRWCLKDSLFSPQATQRGSRRAPDHLCYYEQKNATVHRTCGQITTGVITSLV